MAAPKEKERQPAGPGKLNPEQQAAVSCDARRILVTAGPGTGKTHTLVQRVGRLLDSRSGSMTVITFTNKAVREVRERLRDHPAAKERVRVDTFHGFCLDWLRREGRGAVLAGPEMRGTLLKESFPGLADAELRTMGRRIGLYLAGLARLPDRHPVEMQPYFTAMNEQGVLDLDGVIPACTAMLAADPGLADRLRTEAGCLFVDEFQDLNAGQYELVRILAAACPVFAIGDPDQAIYGFRGASAVWFQRFIDELQPRRFFLQANYRSGSRILEAATRVIAANHRGGSFSPPAAAGGREGAVYWTTLADPHAEARFVAGRIQQLVGGTSHREIDRLAGEKGGTLALSDIAVLYRTGRQAAPVADALAERTIPCQVVDVQPFYLSGDCRMLFHWILLAAGRADRARLLALLGREKGIGSRGLEQLDRLLDGRGEIGLPELQQLLPGLERRLRERAAGFHALGERFVRAAGSEPLPRALEILTDHYGLDAKGGDVLRFLRLAGSAESLDSLALHLVKHMDSVIYDDRAESVLLATLHASKGLEFKAVFIIGCEDGLLPLAPRATLDQAAAAEHEREERRLFFVGMTRAEQVLYLSAARRRTGYQDVEKRKKSPFVADISTELLQAPPVPAVGKRKKKATQLRLF
jgi:superfamily I DNA/RNA helicase